MRINERIFEILKEKKISQKDFSKMTGIAESTISDWKRKGFNPSSGKLSIICDALGITMQDLFASDRAASDDTAASDLFFSVNEDEKRLIELYRSLEDDLKLRALAYITEFSNSCSTGSESQKQVVEVIDKAPANERDLRPR